MRWSKDEVTDLNLAKLETELFYIITVETIVVFFASKSIGISVEERLTHF